MVFSRGPLAQRQGSPFFMTILCQDGSSYARKICDNQCFSLPNRRGGIQPEKVECRGRSPSALSRGLSVSATPGIYAIKRKASERRESSRRGSRFSRLSDASWWEPRYRGFRFAAPSATSHSLRSGIRPFRSCGGWFYHGFSQN